MSTPLLGNILNQPEALKAVSEFQRGPGAEMLANAAGILRSKKRVLLSGMGASYFASIPLQYLLSKSGLEVACIETSELLYFLPEAFNEDTAVILVSRSGESIEVTKLIPQLRARGSAVIGVVNVAGSALSNQADPCIQLNSPADQLVAIQTYTATLAVLALLAAAVVGELEVALKELAGLAEDLAVHIPKWVAARNDWRGFLGSGGPLYILGRGPALGPVSEGVLLMHETAKSAAVGMSVPQFRHGPVEVVDAQFRTIVIGTQKSTADLDWSLAKDVSKMGGQVRWLGPAQASEQSPVTELCHWPASVPQRFSSIVESIPLQIAAYVKAELAGLTPGDFRWAPAITSTESGF